MAPAIRSLCAGLPGSEVAWVNGGAKQTDLELVVDLPADRIRAALWLAADRIGWDLSESADATTFSVTPRASVRAPDGSKDAGAFAVLHPPIAGSVARFAESN